ncbi:putative damage-inducible protein DinB [Flavobacterium cutihirudinis]|uniref:Putative damage-inducible protein DinB n=1 Tax=Flavobacterium cutihirudinis TaxID=1265740 RepID=A0A3D9FYY6_9FLAO|nr:DinB family protein [Flavobacterium cutihirudinis]RED26181.1 putative damage-inducible protein DinB [Flavobacterium cutihirudinis]
MNRKGAIGALLDIYEQAISDLKNVIKSIPDNALTKIIDETANEDCKSLQTILSHVVRSGYIYAINIQSLKEHTISKPEKVFRLTIADYLEDLTNVFEYTENVFRAFTDDELEEYNDALKIKTGWGQSYDIEQLTEHAIVHILRHKRQIEKIIHNKSK